MSTNEQRTGLQRSAVQATAAALRATVSAGRRELKDSGTVSEGTWSAIDELTDSLLDLLPDTTTRRRLLRWSTRPR